MLRSRQHRLTIRRLVAVWWPALVAIVLAACNNGGGGRGY
jgi:hypothetical protein